MPYTRQAYRLARLQCDPTYIPGQAAPTAVRIEAFFRRRYVNDADSTDVEESPALLPASFDLLATPANTTTVAIGGGITVTDAQLAALLRKRCEQSVGV
jgi:hypothetical protein